MIDTNIPKIVQRNGAAYIAGTSMKVRYIVLQARVADEEVAQIQDAYPDLSVAQIRAALDYYCENSTAIDLEIEQENLIVAEARSRAVSQPTISHLRARQRRRSATKV